MTDEPEDKEPQPGYRVISDRCTLGRKGRWIPADRVPNGEMLVRARQLVPEVK